MRAMGVRNTADANAGANGMWRAETMLQAASVPYAGNRSRAKKRRQLKRKRKQTVAAPATPLVAARELAEAVDGLPSGEWLEAMIDHLESSPPPPDDLAELWEDMRDDILADLVQQMGVSGGDDPDMQVDVQHLVDMVFNGDMGSADFERLKDRIKSRAHAATDDAKRRLDF